MEKFVIKWTSEKIVLPQLIGKVLSYIKNGDDEVTIIDAETNCKLLTINNIASIEIRDNKDVHIHAINNSVFLKKISVSSRFKLLHSSSDRINVSGTTKNVKEFTFNMADVSIEEFIDYLIQNKYFSDNINYEPESIVIRRSKEDPHTWIYREDLIR